MDNMATNLYRMGRHLVEVTYKDGTTRRVIPLDIDWEEYEEYRHYVCRCQDPITDRYIDIPNEEIESIRKLD